MRELSRVIFLSLLAGLLFATEALAQNTPQQDFARGEALYDSKNYVQAREAYQNACDANVFAACSKLAEIFERGHGVAIDLESAKILNQKACNADDGHGCAGLASVMSKLSTPTKFSSEGVALLEKGCSLGAARGCTNAGFAYQMGQGVDINMSKSGQFYQLACDLGSNFGCTNIGVLIRDGLGRPEDKPKAFSLFKAACEDDFAQACYNASFLTSDGKSGRDAFTFLRKACDLDGKKWCRDVALRYAVKMRDASDTATVESAAASATRFHTKACQAEEMRSCGVVVLPKSLPGSPGYNKGKRTLNNRMSRQYNDGDFVAALETAVKSCHDEFNKNSCDSADILLFLGETQGVSTSTRSNYLKKLTDACDSGFKDACIPARSFHYKINEPNSSEKFRQAITYYSDECKQGSDDNTPACRGVKRLNVKKEIFEFKPRLHCTVEMYQMPRQTIGVSAYNNRVDSRNNAVACSRRSRNRDFNTLSTIVKPYKGYVKVENGTVVSNAAVICDCLEDLAAKAGEVIARHKRFGSEADKRLSDAKRWLDRSLD